MNDRRHGPSSRLTRLRLAGDQAAEVLVAAEPEQRFSPHWHEEWSIGAVEEGLCEFACAGGRYRASAGSVVVMPPLALHTAGVSVGRFAMAMFYLPAGWVARELGWPEDRRPHMRQVSFRDVGLQRDVCDAARSARVDALPALARRALGVAAPGQAVVPLGPTHDPRLQPALELLARDAVPDMASVARRCALSREHFHRLFRAELGLTPGQYARLAKIVRAKSLLGHGHSPASVAAECGFVDQAHFSRWFRRCFGVTPGRYGTQ